MGVSQNRVHVLKWLSFLLNANLGGGILRHSYMGCLKLANPYMGLSQIGEHPRTVLSLLVFLL